MTFSSLSKLLKAEAERIGFDLVGICPSKESPHWEAFLCWVEAGYAGQMEYFYHRREAYRHPEGVLAGVRSLVMVGLSYRSVEPAVPGPGQGRVSRYAWGADYHILIRNRLRQLANWLCRQVPKARVRVVVDTAPLLERSFAQQAGLGWIGKNTLLIHPQWGSYLFLGALLTDVALEYDPPFSAQTCGRCQACLKACPTGALVEPYVLDARRCISYLTIELRRMPPVELRAKIGDWFFGCDRCQEVCPWNRRASCGSQREFEPREGLNPVDAISMLRVRAEKFQEQFRDSPLRRARREGLARNAAIVLGNRPVPSALSAVVEGLQDPHPMVRAASAWALGQYPEQAARQALEKAYHLEPEPEVRQEIQLSLEGR